MDRAEDLVREAAHHQAYGEDNAYFSSYADIGIHEDMIRDQVRTMAYRAAILGHKDYFKGKTVLDVGAGTGILSVFCAQAGAKKVYAVEASAIARQAQKIVTANGFADVIEVLNDKLENIELPQKVDIIVSEWMGYFLLYESMFESVIYARDNWLVEGGLMMPSRATLYLAAISDEQFVKDRVTFWSDASALYGLDLTSMQDMARESTLKDVHVEWLEPESVIARPKKIKTIDCYTVTVDTLRQTVTSFTLTSMIRGSFTGFGAWFDVDFQRPRNYIDPFWKTLKLTTSPDYKPTHWKQTIFYTETPLQVEQDDTISGVVTLSCNNTFKRWLNMTFEWDAYTREGKHLPLHSTSQTPNSSVHAQTLDNSTHAKTDTAEVHNDTEQTQRPTATDERVQGSDDKDISACKRRRRFTNTCTYIMKDS